MPLSNLKATYVRPFSENKENIKPIQPKKIAEVSVSDGFYDKPASILPCDETKENYLDVVNLVHSKLFANVEEIRKWKTTIELESEQKNKKEEELLSTIESQRKQLLDFQLQNENLNIQLNEEIQQRTLVLEKLHSTKELCSALKKHFNTLQGHYEYGNRIEEIINITDAKRLKAIENLKIKFEKINTEYSESMEYMKNALSAEESKVVEMKETFEKELSESRKENKSLCIMLQNCRTEVQRLSKELEDEKNKLKSSLKEKNNLEAKFLQIQESNEELAGQLQDTENTLKLVESNKIEIERRYLSENNEIKELKKKYDKSIKSFNCLQSELEDSILNLKKTLANSENEVLDIENKLKEEVTKCEKLAQLLQNAEIEKSELKGFVSGIKDELVGYEVLKNDLSMKEQQIFQLSEQNESLKDNLKAKEEEILKYISEKDSVAALCNNKDAELLSLIEKQKNLEYFNKNEVKQLYETNLELTSKLKVLEDDFTVKADLLCSKELEVSSLQSVLNEKEIVIDKLSQEKEVMKAIIEEEKNKDQTCMECQELKTKLENLKNLEDALNKTEQELKKEKKENAEHWRILNYTESRFNDTRIQQEKEILQLQKEIRKFKDEIDLTKLNLDNLDKIQTENACLKEEIEKLKSNSFLEEDISKQKSENQNLKEEASELNLKLNSLNKEMKKLKTENTGLKKTSEKLKSQTEDIKSLKSENSSLKEEIRQLKITKNKELKKLMTENSEKLDSKSEDLKALESENLSLKEQIKQLEMIKTKDLKALQSENSKLLEDIKQLKAVTEKYINGSQSDSADEIEPLKKKRKTSLPNKKSPKVSLKSISPNAKKTFNTWMNKTPVSNDKSKALPKSVKQGNSTPMNKTPVSKDKSKAMPTSLKQGNSMPIEDCSVQDKWETASSESDVFEFVFDQGINGKVKGLSRKGSGMDSSFKSLSQTSPFVGEKPRTPVQETEVKKKNVMTPKQHTNGVSSNEQNGCENFDFISKDTAKKGNNLWFQLKNPPRSSPLVGTPRKFFKTPLANREVFKKPDAKASPWF